MERGGSGNEASTEELSRKGRDCRPPSSYQEFLFPRHQNFRPPLLLFFLLPSPSSFPPRLNFLQNAMFREGTHLKLAAAAALSSKRVYALRTVSREREWPGRLPERERERDFYFARVKDMGAPCRLCKRFIKWMIRVSSLIHI